MSKNSISFTLLIILLFVSMGQTQYKQTVKNQPSSVLQEQQIKAYDAPISTQEAFLETLLQEKKPGGIVLLPNNCVVDDAKLQTEKEYASLSLALNSIVKQDARYRWNIEQGVVNLIPIDNEPDFLKTQIKEFRLNGNLNTDLALEKLLQLPEVKRKADGINLNKGIRFGGLTSSRNTKSRLKLKLRDVTLRQALNEIVRKDGIAVWKYYESTCNGKINSSLEFLVH